MKQVRIDVRTGKITHSVDFNAEEQAALKAADVRTERDRLLLASDYTQIPDSPPDSVAWQAYRQALRDIPEQTGFPDTVEWPEPPE